MHDFFNEKADEFARDLVRAFPQVQEFRQLKSAITLLMNVDPKKPQQIFDTAVLTRYRDTIMSKDDEAFQNISLEELEDESQRNAWLPFVDRLKSMWSSLGETDREAVWKHFFVLLKISDRIKSSANHQTTGRSVAMRV